MGHGLMEMGLGTRLYAYLLLRNVVVSKQLPYDRLKHGIPDEIHQVHFSLLAMAQQAGVELLREDGAHLGEVGGYQAALDGVVDSAMVLVEGR